MATTPPPAAPPPGPPAPPGPGAPITDWRSKSFDFGADATKQLMTVSTGVIAATVIFSKDLSQNARILALIAWLLLLVSVVCGLGALFSMTGQLSQAATGGTLPDLNAKKSGIRKLSKAQIVIFFLGMLALAIFGFSASKIETPPPEKKPQPVVCNVNVTTPPVPPAPPPCDRVKLKRHVNPCRRTPPPVH
jgi:hypothetical protein